MGAEARQRTRREAKRNDGCQAECERPADDARNVRDLIDIPPNGEDVASRQTSSIYADRLLQTAGYVYSVDDLALYRAIDLKSGSQALNVAPIRRPADRTSLLGELGGDPASVAH
jgi:hypothetical protein